MYVIVLYVWIAAVQEFAEVSLEHQYLGATALAECEAAREELTPQAVERTYAQLSEQYGPELRYVAGTCAMDVGGEA